MFVRWKRREPTAHKHHIYSRGRGTYIFYSGRYRWKDADERGASLYAVLVRSARVNGKPRQKVIKHLARAAEKHLDQLWQRVVFWDEVRPKLVALRLPPDELAKIEQQLAAKIEPVPEAEAEQFRQRRAAFWKNGIEMALGCGLLKPKRSVQTVQPASTV